MLWPGAVQSTDRLAGRGGPTATRAADMPVSAADQLVKPTRSSCTHSEPTRLCARMMTRSNGVAARVELAHGDEHLHPVAVAARHVLGTHAHPGERGLLPGVHPHLEEVAIAGGRLVPERQPAIAAVQRLLAAQRPPAQVRHHHLRGRHALHLALAPALRRPARLEATIEGHLDHLHRGLLRGVLGGHAHARQREAEAIQLHPARVHALVGPDDEAIERLAVRVQLGHRDEQLRPLAVHPHHVARAHLHTGERGVLARVQPHLEELSKVRGRLVPERQPAIAGLEGARVLQCPASQLGHHHLRRALALHLTLAPARVLPARLEAALEDHLGQRHREARLRARHGAAAAGARRHHGLRTAVLTGGQRQHARQQQSAQVMAAPASAPRQGRCAAPSGCVSHDAPLESFLASCWAMKPPLAATCL